MKCLAHALNGAPNGTGASDTQSLAQVTYSQFTNDMQWFSADISKITKPTVLQL